MNGRFFDGWPTRLQIAPQDLWETADGFVVRPGATNSKGEILSGEDVSRMIGPAFEAYPLRATYAPPSDTVIAYLAGEAYNQELDRLEAGVFNTAVIGGVDRRVRRLTRRYNRLLARFRICRRWVRNSLQSKGGVSAFKAGGEKRKRRKNAVWQALSANPDVRKTVARKCSRQYVRLERIYDRLRKLKAKGVVSPKRYIFPKKAKATTKKLASVKSKKRAITLKKKKAAIIRKQGRAAKVQQKKLDLQLKRQQMALTPLPSRPMPLRPYLGPALPVAKPAPVSTEPKRDLKKYFEDQQRAEQEAAQALFTAMSAMGADPHDQLLLDLRAGTVGYLQSPTEFDFFGLLDDEDLKVVYGASFQRTGKNYLRTPEGRKLLQAVHKPIPLQQKADDKALAQAEVAAKGRKAGADLAKARAVALKKLANPKLPGKQKVRLTEHMVDLTKQLRPFSPSGGIDPSRITADGLRRGTGCVILIGIRPVCCACCGNHPGSANYRVRHGYTPLGALSAMIDVTDVQDYISGSRFPDGPGSPFAPPRRVLSEVLG